MKVTQGYLQKIFDYHDGLFIHKRHWHGSCKPGKVIYGSRISTGYISIAIDGKTFLYHRMVWLWHNKKLPKCLDHIDRDKANNKIENLRASSYSQNQCNVGKRRGLNPYKGVRLERGCKRYQARIFHNGKNSVVGYYNTAKEAARAYDKKAKEYFGEFAYTNFD